ncbi:putative hydrolase of the HAD superfamily [Deinobacterium chartae]|uniref:Putative hydrolase of the HAD superfamily n=1 Tax=Deinobacterium chartae TaxID=521158 RepID=A0A841HY79_9DEIO|nr:HAD family phosphatase [Deinobacterium chartae]MBB6096745.1 putative hydrolase of the HAD superfamily [Deinobacterium chartae]
MIQAVLFDRDDTLSLTDQDVYRQAAEWLVQRHPNLDIKTALKAMQVQWASTEGRWQLLRTLEDEAAFWDEYYVELAERLGLEPHHGAAVIEAWPYHRFLVPVPGAREVLTELRARGYKVGVLSNTLPNVAVTLEAVGLGDLVDVAISSCTLGVHKPDPQAFLLAAGQLGVTPEEVLFVDDKLENVEAARSVGMQAILIDHHGVGHPEAARSLHEVLAALPA